jgi:hypothetical protein
MRSVGERMVDEQMKVPAKNPGSGSWEAKSVHAAGAPATDLEYDYEH